MGKKLIDHLRRHRDTANQVDRHVGMRFAQTDKIDPTLERLLGRRPRTLAAYIRENADLWAPSALLEVELSPMMVGP